MDARRPADPESIAVRRVGPDTWPRVVGSVTTVPSMFVTPAMHPQGRSRLVRPRRIRMRTLRLRKEAAGLICRSIYGG